MFLIVFMWIYNYKSLIFQFFISGINSIFYFTVDIIHYFFIHQCVCKVEWLFSVECQNVTTYIIMQYVFTKTFFYYFIKLTYSIIYSLGPFFFAPIWVAWTPDSCEAFKYMPCMHLKLNSEFFNIMSFLTSTFKWMIKKDRKFFQKQILFYLIYLCSTTLCVCKHSKKNKNPIENSLFDTI